MKFIDWGKIDAVEQGGDRLPAGGYVVRITNVEDMPDKEYMWIEYDIAEGEHAGHYSDEYARLHPYVHRFSRSYKEKAAGFFKAFLERLQESNPGRFDVARWQQTANEREFVGLELGIVVQLEKYTTNKGEDKERLDVVGIYASQDIRNGDFKLPPVKDKRTGAPKAETPAQAAPYDDEPLPWE